MATPHVCGVAALIKARYPSISFAQIKAKILNSVDRLPQLEDLVLTGGRLNAFRSLIQIAPGRIEAEEFASQSGITTEPTSDTGGGLNVTNVNTGDFLDYVVDVLATETYLIDFRVASQVATGRIELRDSAGTTLVSVNVPNTGGLQAWQTVRATVNLTQGVQTLRVFSASGAWNPNWIHTIFNRAPGRVEAEDFTSQSGITTEPTSDIGGSLNVTNVNTGDNMDYVINVQTTGRYLIQWRVASNVATGQIQLRNSAGTVISSVNVPNTGGLQSWQTGTEDPISALWRSTLMISREPR
jgi:endoglucanase